MSDTDHRRSTDAPVDPDTDYHALIATLRLAGAGRFDPVRVHYLEVLAHRASTQPPSVKCLLHVKLAQALAALTARFEQARCDLSETVSRSAQHHPHATDELHRLFADGDFNGVQRLIATLKTREHDASFSGLVRQLEQQVPDHADGRLQGNTGARPELKVIRNFRSTWAKLSIDRQITQALKHAPVNAGPINSHMLVLRSLALMRDISPDYFNRFMQYTDTLLCLDQGKQDKPKEQKKRQAARTAKK